MTSSSTNPPTDGGSTTVIDCRTCPVRGRLCGDCFVPVLGRMWLEDPAARPQDVPGPTPEERRSASERTGPALAPLDSDELAAVSAFVRAELIAPEEARAAGAHVTRSSAVG